MVSNNTNLPVPIGFSCFNTTAAISEHKKLRHMTLLGKYVHISTCVGFMVANWFPKYKGNQRKKREMLSVACSAGLSVAFGAPIGGVLFSYEEISTYFPRRVMWRSFLCSLIAAVVLKELNPLGTGKLVLFETTKTR